MTPSEIITEEAKKVGYDAKQMIATVHHLVTNGGSLLLNKNNSVLLLVPNSKTSAELHLFTMDSPATLVKSLKYFVDKIKASDIEKVYGIANAKQKKDLNKVLNILDTMGVDVQRSDNPKYFWMATVEGSK
jgi:Fic family protein